MASYECRGKNKLWSVRFDIQENGKSVTKRLSGFTKKKEAQEAYIDYIKNYQEMLKLTNPDANMLYTKFDIAFKKFLFYKKEKVKESSYYDFTKLSDKHIVPF